MKTITIFLLTLLLLIAHGFVFGQDTVTRDKEAAQAYRESMHPPVQLLDSRGNPLPEGTIADFSTGRTCGQCHDTHYIDTHNTHFNDTIKSDCLSCHVSGGKLALIEGPLHLHLRMPDKRNCGQCHGFVHDDETPMTIPDDYLDYPRTGEDKCSYAITQHTGVILSSQDVGDSALNLENKKNLHFPWDVHSRRQLECTGCHFLGNDPRFCGKIPSDLGHLKMDPRKIKSPGEILKRPDHRLKTAACTCCHEPLSIHKSLPYRKRHMEVLSCQACHVPSLYGLALRSVDQTVVTSDGKARIEFRGVNKSKSHGTSLNTQFIKGFSPALFTHVNTNPNDLRDNLISPFNLVTYWTWRSGQSGEPVPPDLVKKAYQEGGQYRSEILKALDKNNDHSLDASELVLDTQEKIKVVKANLSALGVERPEIAGTIKAFQINHGIRNTKHMKPDCAYCHGSTSSFGKDVILASAAPVGVVPAFESGTLPKIDGAIEKDDTGALFLTRSHTIPGHYVFGHSRMRSLDTIGFWIFILSLLAVMFHGLMRFIASRKHPPHRTKSTKVYMYRFYERLWHWTMATGIVVLALTGLEIHYAGSFTIFGLETSVHLHNILAGILIFNAALSLFYHLATGEIKQFFRFNKKFLHETLVQVWFYIYGIFRGKPHPIQKTAERKLNPLQQLTYVVLLNVLLPFQVITGMLIMGVGKWPALGEKVGGLTYLAPIHSLGSWLFVSFIAVHIYLTTTGHSVFSNIRAMITGYDDVEEGVAAPDQTRLMNMKIMDLVGTLIGKKQAENGNVNENIEEKTGKKQKPSEKGGK